MDAPWSPLEFSLLNDWQRDFPLQAQPFARLGAKVGAGETAVIAALQRLKRRGAISRLGAVFTPRRAGAGTLAALAAPPERLEAIAAQISARPEVNHNYQREHQLNLWFVITALNAERLRAAVHAIEIETGCPVLAMPLQREFHIDLGFDLGRSTGQAHDRQIAPPTTSPGTPFSPAQLRLGAVLEDGLAIVARPYAELGARAAMSEDAVITQLAAWQTDGLIKRFGVVVRHHEMGYRANAMVVFDIAEEQTEHIGARLAREPAVTLCYQRQRCLPHWPNNLYCMVHGRSRDEVMPVVQRLAAIAQTTPAVLFSVRRFKQCGARYFAGAGT